MSFEHVNVTIISVLETKRNRLCSCKVRTQKKTLSQQTRRRIKKKNAKHLYTL